MHMKAIVTGPFQMTFPYQVQVVDDNEVYLHDVELADGGMHRDQTSAQAQADEFNKNQAAAV